ncbi:hypothetical protein GCM10020370_58010 [Paenibacillus hodogayensis]
MEIEVAISFPVIKPMSKEIQTGIIKLIRIIRANFITSMLTVSSSFAFFICNAIFSDHASTIIGVLLSNYPELQEQ